MSEPVLIGSGDMNTPYWALASERSANAGIRAVTKAAPRTIAVLGSWAWQASPPLTVLALAVQGLAATATALGLLATATVFTQLLAQGPTPERLLAALPGIALVVAAGVARGLLQAAVGALRSVLTPKIEQRAQDDLYAGLTEVELLAFDDPEFTGLVERASRHGLVAVRNGANLIGDLLAAFVSVVAAVVAAAVLHPVLAPLVLLAATPQAWASLRGTQLKMASFARTSASERRRDITGDLISERENATEVRAFTTQQVLLREHRRITADLTAEAIRVGQRQNLLATTGRALSAVGAGVGYVVLGLLIYTGRLPLPLAGTAIVAMRAAAQSVTNGVWTTNRLFDAGIYVELYRDCLAELRRRRRSEGTRRLLGDPETIELSDVSFRYPAQCQDALTGINLTLRTGEIVALVGENGSGKTTLAKLITGLYLPTDGTVQWDGVSTDKIDANDLHRHIALVPQEPVRWPMTAENNVRIGRIERADPDGADFDSAVSRAGADSVLADLPEGRTTVLSRAFKNGRDLSGGQWQRMSVARGLYRDAALVVADEPTSAMDARAENAVFNALRELSKQTDDERPRITVLITHRLANIRQADQIVVLSEGRIIEHGTHDELFAKAGTYHQLFALQANAYRTQ